PGAFALHRRLQRTLGENVAVHLLRRHFVMDRATQMDQVIPIIQLQFFGSQLALQLDVLPVQLMNIDQRWHNSSCDGAGGYSLFRRLPNLFRRASSTCGGTKDWTSPPRRAISLTSRELRNVEASR